MKYEEIKRRINMPKRSHQNESMKLSKFDSFSVCENKKGEAIIVDNDIADSVSKRSWCLDGAGYPVVNVNGNQIRLHDYVMAQKHSKKPKDVYVDHINQDKKDNRLQNLRFVTPEESSMNMPLKSNNTSGVTGVRITPSGSYHAYIKHGGKQVNLGHYKTLEEAAKARREAETRYGYLTRPATVKEACEMEDANE